MVGMVSGQPQGSNNKPIAEGIPQHLGYGPATEARMADWPSSNFFEGDWWTWCAT